MSTLKVTNIQSNGAGFNDVVSFHNSAGTENGTLCRAWVNFDGTFETSPFTIGNGIRASFNVISVTDNGKGDYTITFTNPMPDANYSMAGSGQTIDFATTGRGYAVSPFSNTTSPYLTTSLRVQGCLIDSSSGTYADSAFFNVAIFR